MLFELSPGVALSDSGYIYLKSNLPFYSAGVGIKTNLNSWSSIVGSNYTGVDDMDIVWVYWNGKQDLTTGFVPFGGWNQVKNMLIF